MTKSYNYDKKAENLKKKVQASEIHLKQFRVECVTFGAKVDDLSVQQISGWLDHWSTRLFAGANTHTHTQHFTCFSQNRSMKLAHRIKWIKTHTHTRTHTRTHSHKVKTWTIFLQTRYNVLTLGLLICDKQEDRQMFNIMMAFSGSLPHNIPDPDEDLYTNLRGEWVGLPFSSAMRELMKSPEGRYPPFAANCCRRRALLATRW